MLFRVLIFYLLTFLMHIAVFAQNSDTLNYRFLDAVFDDDTLAVINALELGADVNFITSDSISALHYSITNRNFALTELLLQKGADVNCQDNTGSSPLALASAMGEDSMMFLLIMEGADIEMKNKDGQTPLHLALLSGNPVATDMLMFYKANPEVKDNDSLTPLHYAAFNGLEFETELLLKYGANSDPVDQNLKSPAFYAIESNSFNVLAILTNAGIDFSRTTKDHSGLLGTAFLNGNDEIIQLLLSEMTSDSTRNVNREDLLRSQVQSSNMWKTALKQDNIYSIRMLRKYNIPRPLAPIAGKLYGNLSVSGFSDFYTTAGLQFYEVNYKFSGGAGFGTRLWRNRVIKEISPDTLYQLREFRGFVYAEIAKYFPVHRYPESGKRIDIVAGLRTPFTWANYSALKDKDGLRITFAPFAGVEYYVRKMKLLISYQYWNYDNSNFVKHMLVVGFGFR